MHIFSTGATAEFRARSRYEPEKHQSNNISKTAQEKNVQQQSHRI